MSPVMPPLTPPSNAAGSALPRTVQPGPGDEAPNAFAQLLERSAQRPPATTADGGRAPARAAQHPPDGKVAKPIGEQPPEADSPTNGLVQVDPPRRVEDLPPGDVALQPAPQEPPSSPGAIIPPLGLVPVEPQPAVPAPAVSNAPPDAPATPGAPIGVAPGEPPGRNTPPLGLPGADAVATQPGRIDAGESVATRGRKVAGPANGKDEVESPIGRVVDLPAAREAYPPGGVESQPAPGIGRVENQPAAVGPNGPAPLPLGPGGPLEAPIGTQPPAVDTPAPPEARLPMAPHTPAFASALGTQLRMWVRDGIQQAVLQLNPADLGPVAVQIALEGSQAHVDFVATQAATRTALEASLPALAAALRDSGLTLAGGGVFDQPRGQPDERAPQPGTVGRAPANDPAPSTNQTARGAALRARGVVDLVA